MTVDKSPISNPNKKPGPEEGCLLPSDTRTHTRTHTRLVSPCHTTRAGSDDDGGDHGCLLKDCSHRVWAVLMKSERSYLSVSDESRL